MGISDFWLIVYDIGAFKRRYGRGHNSFYLTKNSIPNWDDTIG